MNWQLQDAKARFSELVRRALTEGPQTVTRHGEDTVVVLSAAEYERLLKARPSFKEFLASVPLDQLDLNRDTDLDRDVEL